MCVLITVGLAPQIIPHQATRDMAATSVVLPLECTAPAAFTSPVNMARAMYGALMEWGAGVYTGRIKTFSDCPPFKSPLLAIDLTNGKDSDVVIVEALTHERAAYLVKDRNMKSMVLKTIQYGMQLVIESDREEIENLSMTEMAEAMKAAGITVPDTKDHEEFYEEVNGNVMFYFFDVTCVELEDTADQTQPAAKKLKWKV